MVVGSSAFKIKEDLYQCSSTLYKSAVIPLFGKQKLKKPKRLKNFIML